VTFWLIGSWRDKKDAESSKSVTSPYRCTAEAIFGGRKSGKSFLWRNPIGFHQLSLCLCRTKAQVTLLSAFSFRTISADPNRGEIKKMQNRRKTSRRRTGVRQRRFSAVEKADNYFFGEIR
jgi:hypothetical protein